MPTLNSSFFVCSDSLCCAPNRKLHFDANEMQCGPFGRRILNSLTNVHKLKWKSQRCGAKKIHVVSVSSRSIYFDCVVGERRLEKLSDCRFLSPSRKIDFTSSLICIFIRTHAWMLRVASMPNTGVEEEYYRLRHFSITGKGVVNRGDSLKSRRSRSNNSVASSNSR